MARALLRRPGRRRPLQGDRRRHPGRRRHLPPGEDRLIGHEIGFGGDISRSLKDGAPYLVVETQAQGQMGWLPYPGQLRLQAYSHLASGAMGVMYWHWGSLHNSFET
ncbi:beta-galactosidase [Actinomyces sp. oral taxon 414]|uniref:beta-galactosidase n=1 Tax=Actinomyces sp. oral taxon 414 TaxID=712122 RepID=UPI001C124B89|nr:beta-galactosidase [Actinomyces sp. oral taxon 414]